MNLAHRRGRYPGASVLQVVPVGHGDDRVVRANLRGSPISRLIVL